MNFKPAHRTISSYAVLSACADEKTLMEKDVFSQKKLNLSVIHLKRMKKILLLSVIIACIGCAKSGLAGENEQESAAFRKMGNIEFTKSDMALASSVENFGISLFNLVADEEASDNIVISPLSASIALAMTANGANGRTYSQITEALGLKDFSKGELNRYFCKTMNVLSDKDEYCRTDIANSAWLQEGVSIKRPFKDSLKVNYDAYISELDLSSAKAADTINGWVNEHTGGLIDKMVDEIEANTVLILINTLYYSGKWKTAFNEKEVEAVFHAADGKKTCNMMEVKSTFGYYEDQSFQVLELEYANGRQCLDLYLPITGNEKLDPEYVVAASGKIMPEEVHVKLPSFTIESDCDLVSHLRTLGIEDLFDGTRADLSDIRTGDLFVSKVKQKTHMDLNREGTVAGSATEVDFREKAGPAQNFTADHPFYFILRDRPSGAILFIGHKVKLDNPK